MKIRTDKSNGSILLELSMPTYDFMWLCEGSCCIISYYYYYVSRYLWHHAPKVHIHVSHKYQTGTLKKIILCPSS
jgi:hypothetical protein